MGIIKIEGIKIYAYHGCLEEEAKIGGNYIVDVYLEINLEKSSMTDDLAHTIDYVRVYDIVKEQMALRSKLLESVAKRIIDKLKGEFLMLKQTEVKVTKLNPPMNGNVEKVSITIKG